ncbi:hypothetical protein A1O3_04579 [Capronia epimyces CBS 606.96]|uniref:Aminoglycoside phosphotransferase domain-containing protein n=1 Tax=Capronia epimyces CBS 606.96 TaxID=1182542 RepID=W9Y521_9EURO|nr:uncharacterized protein A1O3_04579 [Capronia epimyces CBS 606.96]EXJ87618.1 hypothetical protein A1O3_04579 [Capronia epimyces CBS 606.96]
MAAAQENTQKEGDEQESMAKAIELSRIVEDLPRLNETFRQSQSIFVNSVRRKVFRLDNIVLKFGSDISPFEAKYLRFISEVTNIPVPRVYRDYIHDNGTKVIAMEYIPGRILSAIWPELCDKEKMKLVGQVREILDKIRQHRNTMIGGIYDTPAVDVRMFKLEGGPFSTEEQFNEFLLSDLSPATPEIFRSTFRRLMKTNHNIVLTHCDISPQNIVVNNGQIVGILDWESAGWYPEYWEYVKFFNAPDPSLDWINYAEHIFPETYDLQFTVDAFLTRCLAH